jgi:hypothetical protein
MASSEVAPASTAQADRARMHTSACRTPRVTWVGDLGEAFQQPGQLGRDNFGLVV